MKIQRYYDREKMDWQEKKSISLKSNDLCCHCGQFAFFGHPDHVSRLATIDHVIPISKCGSNQHLNLVMLCEDCNKEKDNKIMPIEWYKYLKDEYKKELEEYIANYMMVMETERTHLLTYDEYTFPLEQKAFMGYKGHHKKQAAFSINVKMKRANWDDFDMLVTYLIKYLKKYDFLDDAEIVPMNIAFWMTFGSIYYIEKNNEINCMIAITIKHVAEFEDYHGIDIMPFMYIFPLYSTENSVFMVYDLIKIIPDYICKEKGLNVMPISAIMLNTDKTTAKLGLFMRAIPADISAFQEFQVVSVLDNSDIDLSNEHREETEMTEDEQRTYRFLSGFKDDAENIIKYLCKYSKGQEIAWMVNCLISYSLIKDTELGQLVHEAEQSAKELSNENQ